MFIFVAFKNSHSEKEKRCEQAYLVVDLAANLCLLTLGIVVRWCMASAPLTLDDAGPLGHIFTFPEFA